MGAAKTERCGGECDRVMDHAGPHMTAREALDRYAPGIELAGVNVRCGDEAIARLVRGSTVVIERARGRSFLGETGEALGFWNLSTPSGKTPLAQGDTAEALQAWALARGARRAEVLR